PFGPAILVTQHPMRTWANSGLCGAHAPPLDKYVDINILGGMTTAGTIPFETTLMVRDYCLCLHVQRASRAIGRVFDDAFRPFGLTNFQFSLLMRLNCPSPPTIGTLAEDLA